MNELNQLNTKPIAFSTLVQSNTISDSNTIVLIGCLFESDDQKKEVEPWMKGIQLIPDDTSVIAVRQITGNVRGDGPNDDSLKCWLIETTPCSFNPMVRLRFGNDFKWTSDFVVNYKNYYRQ